MNKNKKLSDITVAEFEQLIKQLLPNNIYQPYNPEKFVMPYVGDGVPPYLSNEKPCKITTHTELLNDRL